MGKYSITKTFKKPTSYYLQKGLLLFCLIICSLPWDLWVNGDMHLKETLQLPSWQHILGQDSMGRDLFLRLMTAAQDAFLPVVFIATLSYLFGFSLACLQIIFIDSIRGIRHLLPLFFNILMVIPFILLIALLAIFRERIDAVNLWIVFMMYSLSRGFYLIYMLFNQDHKKNFWLTNEILGGSKWQRIWQYGICQHWYNLLWMEWKNILLMCIITENSMSYLGFGIIQPQASLGNIFEEHFQYILSGQATFIFFLLIINYIIYIKIIETIRKLNEHQPQS